jgi:XTP/dITP diphosphohydrolase/ATP diphosphatase
VRRHPHIFGDVEAKDAAAVLKNWEEIKREEKGAGGAKTKDASLLGDIPRSMPAMMEAGKLGSRAAKVGFDWPDANGLFAKLNEEIGELRSEVEEDVTDPAVAEELGDLLFTAVNLARHLKVDPEQALRGANAKFRRRFVAMENEAGGHEVLAGLEPEELERLWGRAKVAAGEAENTRLEDQTKR